MFVDRGVVYADAYCFLQCGNKIGFQLSNDNNISEGLIDFSNIYRIGNTVYYNNGTLAQTVNNKWKYSDYKKDIIKKRYSNDDQIAIILNKDDSEEDQMRYQKMMEWREFSAFLAKKVENLLNLENNNS